jgi:DNA mismatch repair protein MLH3
MFNDSLSVAQCETLVKQLSETVFPFQCAHGRFVLALYFYPRVPYLYPTTRPSLVPLIETGAIQKSTQMYKKRSRKDWDRLETIGDV